MYHKVPGTASYVRALECISRLKISSLEKWI